MKAKRPSPSSEEASRRMKATGGRDTKPEKKLRSLLHNMGLRFRVHQRILEGTQRRADIVFGPSRVAIFVDGCFWHGCREHKSIPKANRAFWKEKISANRRRDADTDRRLRVKGWLPIRIWEHETTPSTAKRIARIVRARKH